MRWHLFLAGMLLCAGCWVKDAEIRRKIEAVDQKAEEETGDTGEGGES
jgi:hypothetical protein